MRLLLCCLLPLGLLASRAAQAEPACDPVVKAMLALSDQPGVRQRTLMGPAGKPDIAIEAISLKDAMYMREGPAARWRKTPFDAAKRRQMAEQALKLVPLSGCSASRGEQLDGVPVVAYDFSQPDLMKPGQLTKSTILIGRDDGLPRRLLLGDGTYQTMEYGNFPAPLP